MAERTLYVRGVPEPLMREAKATAAREGKTLTAFVIEAIGRAVDRPGPDGPGSETPETEDPLSADVAWYEANREKLSSRYPGERLAIVDRKVVDHDRDFHELASRVFSRYGARAILMPDADGESTLDLRTPFVDGR